MSVPVGKRKPSKLEFLNNFYKLRKEMVNLLLRDFGTKTSTHDLYAFCHRVKFKEEDKEVFLDLCERYQIDVEDRFPLWLIIHHRKSILNTLDDLLDNMIKANSIYPTTVSEFEFRKQFQSKAIGCCYCLLQKLQTAISDLPVDVNKYMPYVERIQLELKLLKDWKKSNNKILKAILSKQN